MGSSCRLCVAYMLCGDGLEVRCEEMVWGEHVAERENTSTTDEVEH